MPRKNRSHPSAPLSEVAYQRIKDMIITVRLRPGDQIDEARLADELSIGRTPIRESLFRLAAEGLIQVRPGRGFLVREVTLSDLKDLFETLLILERSAAALAARRIRPEQIGTLRKINADFEKVWRKKDFLGVTLQNSRFHRALYDATDNRFLKSYLDSLQNQSQRLAYLCFSRQDAAMDLESHGVHSIKDHERLIAGLERRDEGEAVRIVTEHIKLFQRRIHQFAVPSEVDMDLIILRE
jgi:DNA-binding GntR family transcriptional regulator